MDAIQALTHLEFPESTREALVQLEGCLSSSSSGGIPGLGTASADLAEQIAEQYIFYSGRGKPGEGLRPMEELQVLEILLVYYEKQEKDNMRHAVFHVLFGSHLLPTRCKLVSHAVSMAVSLGNANFLDSAAVWMQQAHGCSSDVVWQVVRTLVEDYTILVPTTLNSLRQLPSLSRHFTCNFITALTSMYHPSGSKAGRQVLSRTLLELVTDWITADSRLCLVSLSYAANTYALHSQRATLWTSPTKPNTQTPVPGLIRWCTKAPVLLELAQNDKTKTASALSMDLLEEQATSATWSRLHLGVLQTALSLPSVPGAVQLELVTLADMNRIVKDVTGLVKLVPNQMGATRVQTAMDRLVQVLQVALATGGFRCSLADLRNICQQIPPNKLLSILEKQHLSTAPPQMHNVS